jgi:hypothetical protein
MTGKVTQLPTKAQPPLQVTSVDGASAWLFGRQERYNPDLLAARKGGLRIYQRMQDDEQVKAVMRFKRDSIIGRGYEFAFDETELPEEEQKLRSRVMHEVTRQLQGSFADGVVAVLKGMAFGYSLTEIVTANITVDGATYVGLAKLLSRDAASFSFDTDDYGSLKRFYQRVNARELTLDYNRFIHYVQNPDVDPYYGESELKAAYRAWFMKDLDLKLWAAYKERLAGGFVTLDLGESGISPSSPDYQALQSILTNLRSTMGIILPKGVTAEVHHPTSTDVYEKAIQFHDLAIAKSLLIPNLLGLSHTGQTGAYAQSQTQLEAYFMTLATDTARLEQCLNDQLFRPLALQNWDDGEFPPFKFKKASEEHVKWVVTSWKDLAAAGAVIVTEKDEQHLRHMLNFAPRNEEDVALAKVKQEMVPPLPGVGPDGKPLAPKDPNALDKDQMARAIDDQRSQFASDGQPRVPAGDSEGGQWTNGGGGGPAKGKEGAAKGKPINAAKSPKEFNSQVDALYDEQGVADWQSDYFDEISMRKYFGNEQSFKINNAMRTGAELDARGAEGMRAVMNGFKKHAVSLPEGTVLYRSVNGKFADQLASMEAGESFVDKGFTSTAGTIKATERFGKVRMEIAPRAGMKALVYRSETEVLLPAGRKFTIVGKSTKGGITTIRVNAT